MVSLARSSSAEEVEAITAAINAWPKDHELYRRRSKAYAKARRFNDALWDARKALTLNRNCWENWLQMGKALMGANEPEAAYLVISKALTENPANEELMHAKMAALVAMTDPSSKLGAARTQFSDEDAEFPAQNTRVFCVSDVHVDQHGNMDWCHRISPVDHLNDVLLVAGDVGDSMAALRIFFQSLRPKFRRIFFTPGNHDLWLRSPADRSAYPDSICKLIALQSMCEELGVEMGPARIAKGLSVVPLYSWYNAEFDEQDPRQGIYRFDKFCMWPIEEDQVWRFMLKLNGGRLKERYKNEKSDVVFTMSHFLPRTDLPYSKFVPEMAKAVGCKDLDRQIEQVDADVHIFGHSHVNTDTEKERGDKSTKYVQFALEGHNDIRGSAPLYCIWDGNSVCGSVHRSPNTPP